MKLNCGCTSVEHSNIIQKIGYGKYFRAGRFQVQTNQGNILIVIKITSKNNLNTFIVRK
jgi:hypothetical protein